MVFAAIGNWLLEVLGISLAALRTAGGIMLLLMGLDMVFARGTANTTTVEEDEEAMRKHDVSVFPLAPPSILGARFDERGYSAYGTSARARF